MKKANLLSKADMKKVMGGDPGPEPGGICSPTIYCIDPSGLLITKVSVGDCESISVYGACYETGHAVDLSYCDSCN